MNLQYWRHHLDPAPILAHTHVPLASTLMGMADRLEAVLGLLANLSDEQPEEKEHGVAVASMAVAFALKILRHLGLGDDSPAPTMLNLKMAQMVMDNLLATVGFYLDQWRESCRDEADEGEIDSDLPSGPTNDTTKLQNTQGLIIDTDTFTVTYNGKSCELGNTMAFRLIERFSTARGIYLSISELIQDVWHGKDVSNGAVQHQITNLRNELKAAGIEGIEFKSQPQHYRLILR